MDLEIPNLADPKVRKPLYAVAGEKKTGEIILNVVNTSTQAEETTIQLNGAPPLMQGIATVLTSTSPADENSFENPTKIAPQQKSLGLVKLPLAYSFPPYSITVIKFDRDNKDKP